MEIPIETQSQITYEDFTRIDMRVGTILNAVLNLKAKTPAYVLTIDFGEAGIKESSAQITQNYTPEKLIGRQIVAVINFPPKRVAGVKSEVLVLAAICPTGGTILLQPERPVNNFARVF